MFLPGDGEIKLTNFMSRVSFDHDVIVVQEVKCQNLLEELLYPNYI